MTYMPDASWKTITFDPTVTAPGSALDFSRYLDAPAGKHGALISRNGAFCFADAPTKPVRFYGINIGVELGFLDHTGADKLVAALAASGYNVVRFHSWDWQLPVSNSPEDNLNLNPARVDNFNYFVSRLKAAGIYYTIEMGACRYQRSASYPELQATGTMTTFRLESMGLVLASDRLVDNICTFFTMVMTQTNSYTSLALKDDPALISIEMINEDAWWKVYYDYPDTVQLVLDAAFSQDAGTGAPAKWSSPWETQMSAWLQNRQVHVQDKFRAAIAALGGVPHLVTDMSCRPLPTGSKLRKDLDFVDMHTYWAQPHGTFAPVDQSTQDVIQGRLRTPMESAASRLWGQPMVVGEFNIMSPHSKRIFVSPLMAAFAGLQGWSEISRCNWGQHEDMSMGEHYTYRLEVACEPAGLLSERIGNLIYSQNESQPAPTFIPFVVTPDFLDRTRTTKGGYPYTSNYWELGSYAQLGTIYYDPATRTPDLTRYPFVVVSSTMSQAETNAIIQSGSSGTNMIVCVKDDDTLRNRIATGALSSLSDTNHTVSETGQITTDFSGTLSGGSLKIVTPRSETFLLSNGGTTTQGSVVGVTSDTPGVCFLGGLDPAALSESNKQLGFFLTDTQNRNSVITYTTGSLHVVNGGTETVDPHLALQGNAIFTIASGSNEPLPQVWVLGYDGSKKRSYLPKRNGDSILFPFQAVTSRDAYFAFEVDWPFFTYFGGSTSVPAFSNPVSPSRRQFDDISAETPKGGAWSISQNRLKLVHPPSAYSDAGNGAGFTRCSGTADCDTAEYDFTLGMDLSSQTFTSLGTLEVGAITSVTGYKNATPSANLAAQMTISGTGMIPGTSTKIYCLKMTGTTSPYFAGGSSEVWISWMVNQSGGPKTYLGPDNAPHSLADGTSDVWVSGTLAIRNAPRPAGSTCTQLGGLRFRAPASGINSAITTTFKFGNVAIIPRLPEAPIYAQDFGSSTNAADYWNASAPSLGQFNDLGSTLPTDAPTISQGKLQLLHPHASGTTSGAGFTRFCGTDATTAADYSFKIYFAASGNTYTDLGVLDVGSINSVTDYGSASASSNITGQLTFSGTGMSSTNTKLYYVKTSGTSSVAFPAGESQVDWMLNESGSSLNYVGPDNAWHALASSHSDLWINSTLAIANVPRPSGAGGTRVDGFRFHTPGHGFNPTLDATFTIDDFSVKRLTP